jgi:hypothetical protein
MKAAVTKAIDELRATFPDATVTADPDNDGGAYVTIEPVEISGPYVQTETWVRFHIGFQYPASDVYPHFVRSDLARTDGAALGEGMSGPVDHRGRPAIQVSRRSNRLDPSVQTAAHKLLKVIAWMEKR